VTTWASALGIGLSLVGDDSGQGQGDEPGRDAARGDRAGEVGGIDGVDRLPLVKPAVICSGVNLECPSARLGPRKHRAK
jgi:hypothetical protein